MRILRLPVLVAAVIGMVLTGTGTAAAGAQQDGVRIGTASAWFADPEECAAGSCQAVFVSVMSGSLGFASGQTRYPGQVIVGVASAALVDGELTPTSDPAVIGCTDAADVTVSRDLARAGVDTHGPVQLSDLTDSQDCAGPNGHYLTLSATWTGTGDVMSQTRRTQYATPWQHDLSSNVEASRAATVTGEVVLDGVGSPAWASTGWLRRETSRDTTVLHSHAVGTTPRLPLPVTPHSVLSKLAVASVGDWTLDAQQWSQAGAVLKTNFAIVGMVDGAFVWSEQPITSTVSIADDLSSATLTATLPLSSDAGPIGVVSVTATVTGSGDAWRVFDHVVGGDSYTGHGEAVNNGAQRDASSSLTITGDVTFTGTGGGFLAESVTKSSSSQNG
jgi:hypothetical protein